MHLGLQTVRVFDDDVHALLQRLIRIDAVLDAFAIRFDRRDRRLQVMRDVMDHLLFGLLLLLQFFAHAHQRVCQLADLILAIELQRRFLARLDLLDVIADLVERMDERDHPQHQDQEDEAERHHRDVEDAVDHHVLGPLGILLIHIRHEDIARTVVHQPHAVTILLSIDLHMTMGGAGQSVLIDRHAL